MPKYINVDKVLEHTYDNENKYPCDKYNTGAVYHANGKWIGKSGFNYVNCSECKVEFSKMLGKEFRYCPICGAKMTNFGLRYKDE